MDRIQKIINAWDPINLFPCAPEDEYIVEVKKIKELVSNNHDLGSLSQSIRIVFIESFSEGIFQYNVNDCRKIAKEIIEGEKV